MKSLLLVAISAFLMTVLTTGCGSSSPTAPANVPADSDPNKSPDLEPKKKNRIPGKKDPQ